MKDEEKYWDRASKGFDNGDKVDDTYLRILSVMKKHINKSDILMDFGCATGSIAIDLSGNVDRVIGIDISSEMIRLAKEKAIEHMIDNVYFQKSTIFDEKHKKDSFDGIIAFNILHLLDDPESAIKRISGLLKDDGIFISNTACLASKGRLVSGMMTMITKLPFLPYVKNLKVSELKNMVERNGFEILESMTFEDEHHPLIIAKKV